jgi:hypothetical protein
MEFNKIWISRWGNLVVKCVLSCVVVWMLLSSLNLMRLWYAIHPVTRRDGDELPVSTGANQKPEVLAQDNEIFWPQYFGSDHSSVQQVTINGVQMTSQTWETTVPAKDVIAYYREQMTARGWQDVTEETYKFQPELRDPGISKNSLQDQQYLKEYSETMDSNLILRRGDWSIQVMTARNEGKLAQTAVRICAAATPSIEDFVAGLTSDFAAGSDAAQSGRPLDMEQESGGHRYHTTIAAKSETPTQAFQEALAKVGTQGWRPVFFLPKQQTQSGYFAWLVRGKDYAALSVKALPQGQSSSVTLTEVTPEARPNK